MEMNIENVQNADGLAMGRGMFMGIEPTVIYEPRSLG